MANPHWPIAGIRVRTPRLELRPAWAEADVTALTTVAAAGIHDPASMPFQNPWTDVPSPRFERNSVQHFAAVWGRWAPENWSLPFAVVAEGEVAGVQTVSARDFAIRRTITTGSWLGRSFHGRGIGKEMRSAVLHFAFAALGADRAETGAFEDNAPSLGVTRSLGYESNGDEIVAVRGERRRELKFVLTRERWSASRREDIQVEGVEDCDDLFGSQPNSTPGLSTPAGS